MKKNSFKRFLAVTLAAATALTFAPVSTLGLSGVIEAQAAPSATVSITAGSDASGLTAGAWDPMGIDKSVTDKTFASSATLTAKYLELDLTGGVSPDSTATKGDVNYTISAKGSSTDYSESSGVTSSSVKVDGVTRGDQAKKTKLILIAKKKGITVYTITSDQGTPDDTSDDLRATLTVTVNDKITAKPVFKDGDSTITELDMAVGDSAKTITADLDGEIKGNTLAVVSTQTGVANVSGSETQLAADGRTTFKVTPVAAGTSDIQVLDATSGNVLGTLKVVVSAASFKVTAPTTNLTAGKASAAFTIHTDASNKADDTYTFAIKKGSATVTSDFVLLANPAGGAAYANPKTYAVGEQTDSFYVEPKSSVSSGTYTIEVTRADKNGKTLATASTTFVVGSDSVKTYADGKAINAKPQDDLILTDKTTYNLVDNVTISYGNVVYPASQLTWYLTDGLDDYSVGAEIKDLASKTDANVNLGSDEGVLKAGKGILTLNVNDAEKAANKIKNYYIAATASINGKTTLVYKGNKVEADFVTGKTQVVKASISASSSKDVDNNSFLDGQRIYNGSQENYYLKADDFNLTGTEAADKNIFAVDLKDENKSGYSVLKGSTIKGATSSLANGIYYETVYQKYNTNNVIKLVVAVSINAGPKGHVSDGAYVYAATDGTEVPEDATLYMDLKQNKTFSIPDHFTADTPNTSLSYDTNSANVTVDSKGVITAVSEGTCDVTVKPTANGVDGTELIIHVQVNANPFNTFSVNEEKNVDDKATVLNEKDFKDNPVDTEAQLVTKKIDYVEVFVTGNETQNVTETPVVTPASKTNITYSFYKDYSANGLTIDPKTGKITIDYTKIKDGTAEKYGKNLYAVKVVADAASDAAQTTGYFYVVVDYPDQKISGIVTDQDYIVGTCAKDEKHATAVDLYKEESGKSATKFMAIQSNKTYDFVGKPLYDKDSIKSFETSLGTEAGSIVRAYTADKTMHVLAYNDQDAAEKLGYTAVIASFKSAAADDNYVSKIVNKETGEVLYDHTVNAGDTARELKIDKTTTIQVTLAHPVASAVSGSAVHLSISKVENDGHIYNQQPYVTGVVNSKEVDVALYPNNKGTSVIELGPTGHLTKTNRTDIHHNTVKVAVTYTGEASADAKNPAQVKGVKVSNKKGAKVTVTFNKITANSTMRYYVQKKIGKKVSGKSIGSTKTTLSVKKGATVKVRVKAYYYDANGVKHVGKYSAWKTLKTDKK